jgi:acylphosphatase
VNKTYTADDAGDHTIVVTDDDGNKVTITTIVTVDDDGNITVVSTTDPADGFATFDEKADEGKTSTISVAGHDDGKNHTYTAVDENGKDVPVTVDENGNVTFDQTYTAADAGDHVYKITDDEGNVVTVTVTVGDDGSVRMTLTDPCEGFAAFDADDEPKSVEESVTIAKRADGEDHTYTAVDENGATVEVKTDADGNPVVDKTYTADDAGTHTVVVTDDDGNKVTITTVVTVDADGTVTATSTTDPADGFATFDEKTDETKTATITVPDRSDGEDHTYTAEDENGNPVDVTVDENGNVTFNQDFGPDDAGDHTYTVTDDDGNTVTVTVSVDDKGDVTLTLTDPADGFASFDEEEDAKTRHHLRRWA